MFASTLHQVRLPTSHSGAAFWKPIGLPSVLTRCGASVDWKCSSTPIADICSSHLRLVSLPSSWYSPALLNRDRNAASSCSASVHRAPVAAWQKITSRRSCRDVSGVGGCERERERRFDQRMMEKVGERYRGQPVTFLITCVQELLQHILYSISLDLLRGYLPLTNTICHCAQFKVTEASCALTSTLIPVQTYRTTGLKLDLILIWKIKTMLKAKMNYLIILETKFIQTSALSLCKEADVMKSKHTCYIILGCSLFKLIKELVYSHNVTK